MIKVFPLIISLLLCSTVCAETLMDGIIIEKKYIRGYSDSPEKFRITLRGHGATDFWGNPVKDVQDRTFFVPETIYFRIRIGQHFTCTTEVCDR